MPDQQQQQPEDTGSSMAFDDVDSAVSMVTRGDPIRSLMHYPTSLVDEAKIRLSADGLSIQAVDAANVGIVEVTAHADGFTGYRYNADRDEIVIGVAFDYLTDALSFARKRQNDPVRIDLLGDRPNRRLRVSVQRPDQQVKRVSEFYLIDPDSIRQEPDLPDLTLPYRGQPGIEPLVDAANSVGATDDHAWFAIDGNDLVVGTQPTANPNLTEDDNMVNTVVFPNAAWVDDGDAVESDVDEQGSLFSLDYLKDMARALKAGKADRVSLQFGNQFPVIMDFDQNDWGFDGTFMLAPRIRSDD